MTDISAIGPKELTRKNHEKFNQTLLHSKKCIFLEYTTNGSELKGVTVPKDTTLGILLFV